MTESVGIKRKLESDDEEAGTMEMTTDILIDESFTNFKPDERNEPGERDEPDEPDEPDELDVPGQPRKKSSRRGIKYFQQEWFDEFPAWKEWVIRLTNDSQYYCKFCDKTMSCGRKEILNHEKTIKHAKKRELAEKMVKYGYVVNHVSNVPVLFAPPGSGIVTKPDDLTATKGLTFKQKLREAEHKITQFFVDNNIPFMLSPKLVKLFKDIEPLVLKDIKLSSSKMSLVAKEIHGLKTGEMNVVFPRTRIKQPIIVEPKY